MSQWIPAIGDTPHTMLSTPEYILSHLIPSPCPDTITWCRDLLSHTPGTWHLIEHPPWYLMASSQSQAALLVMD